MPDGSFVRQRFTHVGRREKEQLYDDYRYPS